MSHHHDNPWAEAPAWAREIRNMLALIISKENIIMSDLTDAADRAEASAKAIADSEDAAEASFKALADLIASLKTATTDPATLARINEASALVNARAARLAAAVVAAPTS